MAPGLPSLRLGTRGSPLALRQAGWIAERIRRIEPGISIETVTVRTLAEKFPEKEIPEIGTGIFTRELDEALLRGEIDLAVHSLKDVPTEVHPDLEISGVPERESPLDAFISRDGTPLLELPRGSRIGTGSPRRRSQLLHSRSDFEIVPLRGNVGTRIEKMKSLGLGGTILAHAGLRRLGEEGRITHLIEPAVLLPAVSQGALCVMTRAADARLLSIASRIDDTPTRLAVTAERAFLRGLRGGCQVPAGALAIIEGGSLRLEAVIAAPDGSSLIRQEVVASCPAPAAAEAAGAALAGRLLQMGGEAILRSVRKA